MGTLSVFRWVESKLPSQFYALFMVRFARGSQIGEDALRDLIMGQGFSIANLNYCLDADEQYFEYRYAENLVAGDSNGVRDVFVRDRQTGATKRVSVDSSGAQANGDSSALRITPDGRYVSIMSYAGNLVVGDTNGKLDVFVHDRRTGTTERRSVDSSGAEGDGDSWGGSMSPDSRYVAFSSHSSFVTQDSNSWHDIYVRDRDYSPMTSLCDPGSRGVIACPCSNPPSGPGRGCDNSSGTGGASLSSSGVASLSADTLVFTTSGEKPTAPSIVAQGDAILSSGVVFGQGVSCVAGSLERLCQDRLGWKHHRSEPGCRRSDRLRALGSPRRPHPAGPDALVRRLLSRPDRARGLPAEQHVQLDPVRSSHVASLD